MIVLCCVECIPNGLSLSHLHICLHVCRCLCPQSPSLFLVNYVPHASSLSFSLILRSTPCVSHVTPSLLLIYSHSVFIFLLDVVDFSLCLRVILFSSSPSLYPLSLYLSLPLFFHFPTGVVNFSRSVQPEVLSGLPRLLSAAVEEEEGARGARVLS